MKKKLSYIVFCTLWLSLSLCTSCNAVDEAEVDRKTMLVTFSLDVKSQSDTRATDDYTWGGAYPSVEGTQQENRIDPSSILVFAYKTDGTFVAQLPILTNTTDNEGKRSIRCAFPLSSPYKTGVSYRFMVLANCVSANYGISLNANGEPQIGNLAFTAPFNGLIPMWGVKTYQIPTTQPADKEFKLGVISLLRATAKVGVKLDEKLVDEGYTIQEIKLNYANANGYSAPEHWDKTSSTDLLLHDEVFRPNTAAGEITGVSAVSMSVDDPGTYYIYVPETENKPEEELSIAVTLEKDGKQIEFPYENGIRFCYYENGKPCGSKFNIVRNHFYDYTITEINVGLKMNLVVAEWEDESVWDLDFSAPIHTKLMTTPNIEADAPTAVPTMRFDNSDASGEAGAFVGYFMMEAPKGMTWRPTLANASTTDYEVRVYKTDGIDPEYKILVTDNAIPAEKGYFYKIVVVPLNPNNEGNVVKFGLTYTADWNAEANPLLIINKGEGENPYYYPWDGSDKKDNPDIHWIPIRQEAPVASMDED